MRFGHTRPPSPPLGRRALAAPALTSVTFPTNLQSFVSLGKAHKLHNAIDHWLAGVARQARVALDFITEGERAVDKGLAGGGRARRWTAAAAVRQGQGGVTGRSARVLADPHRRLLCWERGRKILGR